MGRGVNPLGVVFALCQIVSCLHNMHNVFVESCGEILLYRYFQSLLTRFDKVWSLNHSPEFLWLLSSVHT